ncbi:MAG: tetratricopeptide repeat protein [Dehalococcoidia bacterium]
MVDKEDRDAALTVLSGIDIANCEDPEILELYLAVRPHELPFKTMVDILDRILANTYRASDVLQYTITKGIAYCLINEIPEGCHIMGEAISQYRSLAAEHKTLNGDWHLANGLQFLGEFEGKPTVVRESITCYIALQQKVSDMKYAAPYSADLEKSLGDCWSFLGNYDEAVRHYDASLKQESADLTRIFLARAQANLGAMKAARETLLSVDSLQFDVYAHYDFAMSWACLATQSLDSEDIETAKLHLKKAQPFWPIFVSHRDSALIGLLEMSPRKTREGFRSLMKVLNRYVSLNPNLFGIGINVNRIVDDVGAIDTNRISNKTS